MLTSDLFSPFPFSMRECNSLQSKTGMRRSARRDKNRTDAKRCRPETDANEHFCVAPRSVSSFALSIRPAIVASARTLFSAVLASDRRQLSWRKFEWKKTIKSRRADSQPRIRMRRWRQESSDRFYSAAGAATVRRIPFDLALDQVALGDAPANGSEFH